MSESKDLDINPNKFEVIGGLAVPEQNMPEEIANIYKNLGIPEYPYFYHTGKIADLNNIIEDNKLKSPKDTPIMFTSDRIKEQTGEILSNGLTDPVYQTIVGRAMRPGRVMFVFDKSVKDAKGFIDAGEGTRYPEADEVGLENLKALLVLEEDRVLVEKIIKEKGMNTIIATQDTWEKYAYNKY